MFGASTSSGGASQAKTAADAIEGGVRAPAAPQPVRTAATTPSNMERSTAPSPARPEDEISWPTLNNCSTACGSYFAETSGAGNAVLARNAGIGKSPAPRGPSMKWARNSSGGARSAAPAANRNELQALMQQMAASQTQAVERLAKEMADGFAAIRAELRQQQSPELKRLDA